MSKVLESRIIQFRQSPVHVLAMLGDDARALLDAGIADQMPNATLAAIFRLLPKDRDLYVNTLIVNAYAVATLGSQTTLGALLQLLKALAKKYPTFAPAARTVFGTACVHIANAVAWNPWDLDVLRDDVRGKSLYNGDNQDDPIRDRINFYVADWLTNTLWR